MNYEPEPLDDDVPNPRTFTRIYLKNNGGSYDMDGDILEDLKSAIDNNKQYLEIKATSCGEKYVIMIECIEAFALKTVDSMRKIWENEQKWSAYHKSVMGYQDD